MPKKITTQDWIEKVTSIHGSRYSYDKSIYKSMDSLIIITCSIHGDFEQKARDHARGSGCHKCGRMSAAETRRTDKKSFIKKARFVHGEKYDYSKVKYISNRKKVVITCPVHGDFEQTPSNHLKGYDCKKCGIDKRSNSQRSNTQSFIAKARAVHGDKYDYSDSVYTGAQKIIHIKCPKHGVFSQTATSHLGGVGCYYCGLGVIERDEFVSRSQEIHGDKYDYSLTERHNPRDKVVIICKKHGVFEQSPTSHLMGHGCKQCANENSALPRSGFTKLSKTAYFYIIKCFNENESFVKVGITTRGVHRRMKYCLPYEYKEVFVVKGDSGDVYDLEKEVLTSLSQNKYEPQLKFGGSTECFDITEQQALEVLNTAKDSKDAKKNNATRNFV